MSWVPITASLSSISPSPPPELPREHTEGSLTSLAREEAPASTLAGTRVTIGEGVPDLLDTSLPSSGGEGVRWGMGGKMRGMDDGDYIHPSWWTAACV